MAPAPAPSGDDPGVSAAAFFAAVSADLLATGEEEATLDRICARAVDVIPGADYSGVTVRRRRGRLETVASTGPVARELDALQYELGEGPCLDSALEDETHVVDDLRSTDRWPRWSPLAVERGVLSLASIQLPAREVDGDGHAPVPLGALNLYAEEVGAFDGEALEHLRVYATHAANALASARLVGGLRVALNSRHAIGVAQGILMQRYDIDMDRAFDVLQRYASTHNVKLRDLAALVVEERNLPSEHRTESRAEPRSARGGPAQEVHEPAQGGGRLSHRLDPT
jgi:hypothetical protein